MNRVDALTITAVLVSLITYGIIEWQTENITPEATTKSIETPNFTALELKSKIYTTDGSLSHVVNAQKMEHFEASKITRFKQPHYTIYPSTQDKKTKNTQKELSSLQASSGKNDTSNTHKSQLYHSQQSPWNLSAKEATLYKDNRVVLNSRVRLKAIDAESIIQEVHCKHLELDLTTNIISSEQTVMIQGKDFTMYGSGLSIDLNNKTMTLSEHVRTVYKKI
ncbi:MAG: LPS export ABC transporter periplasmic protein LptC [Colwellia sp.]